MQDDRKAPLKWWTQLQMDIDELNNLFIPPDSYEPDFLDNLPKEIEGDINE